MILSNLFPLQNVAEFLDDFNINTYNRIETHNFSRKYMLNSIPLAYVIKDTSFFLDSKHKLAKKKLIQNNLWQNFVNIFWQQTVFLSTPDKISNKYINRLNSFNLSKDQSSRKLLLLNFSKSLLNGSVESSLNQNTAIYKETIAGVQYLWPKRLIIKQSLSKLWPNKYKESYQNWRYKKFANNLQMHNLPLFIVSNHLSQMIIAEPPGNLNFNTNLLNSGSFVQSSYTPYEGWFFTNVEDAQEYMRYINKSYCLNNKHHSLRIFTTNLSNFYYLSAKFRNRIQLRLVPDLKEISSLIHKYRYYNNIVFHQKQKYGRAYFQGQPLYMLKNDGVGIHYKLSKSQNGQVYNTLFTNYETTMYAWKVLKTQSQNTRFIKKPQVLVYNLESFITDQLNYLKPENEKEFFLIVPSRNSYKFIKKHQLKAINYNSFLNYISYFQLWTKRVMWSLTSKRPANW